MTSTLHQRHVSASSFVCSRPTLSCTSQPNAQSYGEHTLSRLCRGNCTLREQCVSCNFARCAPSMICMAVSSRVRTGKINSRLSRSDRTLQVRYFLESCRSRDKRISSFFATCVRACVFGKPVNGASRQFMRFEAVVDTLRGEQGTYATLADGSKQPCCTPYTLSTTQVFPT